MKKISGFTLVELVITVTIASILLMVAIPSFTDMIRSNRIASAANDLVGALALARGEAAKRGEQVTVAKTGTNWEGGWQVFSDPDGDGVLDTGETQLQVYDALSSGYTLRATNYTSWAAYLPSGLSTSNSGLPNGTFSLCADDGVAANGRNIVINNVGRVRLDEGASSCP